MLPKPLMTPLVAVLVGGLGLLLEIVTILPPIDDAVESNSTLHYTQHGLVFLGGLLMGLALRDLFVAGRGPAVRAE